MNPGSPATVASPAPRAPAAGAGTGPGPGAGPSPGRPPWWRELWVRLAFLLMVGQIAIFWRVTPDPAPAPRVTPAAPQRFAVEPAVEADAEPVLDPWRWLFTPGLWVRPSAEDFSGPAWLSGTAVRIEVEAFDVPERPLPWAGERPGVLAAVPAVRRSLGPAILWGIPDDSVVLPPVSAPPLPAGPRVRLLGGLAGRRLREGVDPEVPGPNVPARPVVVRVRIDFQGEPMGPPVVWDSSELPAADEAAVRWVRAMRFEPVPVAGNGQAGLVEIEWVPAAVPGPGTRKGNGA